MEDNVKQALLDGTATIQTEIEILSKDNTDNVILTEENGIVSWDYEDFRYVKDEGWIGQFIAKQVNGTIKNISDDFSMTDKEFVLKMGVNLYYNIMNVDEEIDRKHHIYGASTQFTTTGKNKLDISYLPISESESILNGGSYSFDEKTATLTLNATNASDVMTVKSSYNGNSELLLKAGTYYSQVRWNAKKVSDGTSIQYREGVVNVEEDIYIVQWYITCVNGLTKTIYPQIEDGDSMTSFEKYTGGQPSPNPDYPSEIINKYNAGTYQTIIDGKGYVFTISDDLSGIGDVKNELVIDKENGTFEFTKRVGKIVLDGSKTEIWYQANGNIDTVYVGDVSAYGVDKLSNKNGFISDKFQFLGDAQLSNLGNAMSFGVDTYANRCYIQLKDSGITSSDEFKTWLSENPVTVYYVLAEPVTITGTLEEKEYDTHWYSLGNFLVNKVTDDEVGDKTTFEALDYTKKFNQKYVDTITYPCTALELAQNVCQQCGCELGNTNFKHNDWEITGNVFTNGESCRDVLKAIAKLAYSWVRVDWDNKVYLDFTVNKTTEEYNKITNHEYYTLKTQKEKIGAINRVVIGYKDIEGERTKVENTEDIETNGVHEITIFDNPLVYNQELREKAIIGAEELLGLEYMPMEMLTVGHPWLRGDELLEVTDMEGNVHKTVPFDRTIQYFGHIKTNINVATNTKTNTEYSYEGGVGGRLRKTEISVDKINGQIIEIIKEQDETTEKLNETISTVDETKQTISKVETTVTDITTTTQTSTGGNTLHIEEALESNALDYIVEGMSYQETTVGNQLVDFSGGTPNVNTVRTFENDVLIIAGDNSNPYRRCDYDITNVIINNPTKILYFDFEKIISENTPDGSVCMLVINYNDGTNASYHTLVGRNLEKNSYKIPDNTSNILKVVLGVYTTNNATAMANTITITKPMLQFGTDKLDYEPYTGGQPSPSPDYPQDIEVVEAYNLFDKDNVNINYYVKPATGELIENQVWNTSDFIEVSINTPYTLSGKQSRGSAFAITEYDENKQLIKRSTSSSSESNYFSVTTTSTTKYVRASYRNDKITDEIQVIEGTTPKPYTPYGCIRNKFVGKNLFDKNNVDIIDAYLSTSNTGYLIKEQNPNMNYTLRIKCNPNTTYTISKIKSTRFRVASYPSLVNEGNLNNGVYNDNGTNVTITTGTEDNYIYLFYWTLNGDTLTSDEILNTIQLEESSVATEYEPYQENTLDINLQDNFMAKIGDVADTLRVEDSRAILTKRIGNIILDGSESWKLNIDNTEFKRYAIDNLLNPKILIKNDKILVASDYFQGISSKSSDNGELGISQRNNAGLMISIDICYGITTLEEFKTWLSENPVTIYYVLAEPYEVDLGDINIPLFEGINNISLIQDLETTTSIRYLRETPLSGDSLLKQQLDATNDGLLDTNNQVNQNTSDINNTNVNLNNNYYNKNQIDVINSSTSQELTQIKNSVETKITAEDLNIAIAEIKTTGVTSVTTETGYTFDKDGLKIQKSDSEMSSQLDNDGLVVKRDNTEVLTVRSAGVETENLTVRTYFTIGDNTRVENYKGGTGFFYVGGAN